MAPRYPERLGDFQKETGRNSSCSTFSSQQLQTLSETLYLDQQTNAATNNTPSSSESNSPDSLSMKVHKVSQSIEILSGKIAEIKSLQQSILAVSIPHTDVHEDLQRFVHEFRTLFFQTRTLLLDLDQQNQLAARNGEIAQAQIGKGQQAGLARRVAELVAEYSQLQNCYHQQCAQRLRRQLQIAGDVDEILNSDNPRPLMLTQGIIAESDEVEKILRDLEARHSELKTLEQSVSHVRDLFVDLGLMVLIQDETVNQIETTVNMNSTIIENTGSFLEEAQKIQKQNRLRKAKLITSAVFIFFLIVFFIVIIIISKV